MVGDPVTLTPEIPSEVTIAIGQAWSLVLPRPSGGYRWSAEVIEGDADALDVAVTHAPAPDREPGTTADQLLTIRGAAVGHAGLRLLLGRSWEPPSAAIDERAVAVTVQPERS